MAARAIASTTISFGLVSLPVKLYSTGEPGTRVSFNLVHGECGTRLKQHYTCPQCDVVVGRDEMVKGYEFSKGQYVLFGEDELKAIEAPKTDGIEITEFVPDDRVSPIYQEKAYYIGPDKGGARAYRLLSAALREAGRVAIAKYATRGKQYVVMLRPEGEGLVLDQLRYADEVRSFDEVPIDAAEVKAPELQLALQLIDQVSADEFHPEKYEDDVRKRIQEQIQRKVEGQEIQVDEPAKPQTQIIDLMEALKASLAAKGLSPAQKGEEAPAEERKPAKRAPREAKAEKKASSRK